MKSLQLTDILLILLNTIVDVLKAAKIFLTARLFRDIYLSRCMTWQRYSLLFESLPMQKCQPASQPRGSVTWTLISVMASSGVVKIACVAGAERWGVGRGEIIREGGGSGRKGVMQAFQPHFIYNYVECKLRNTERSIGSVQSVRLGP